MYQLLSVVSNRQSRTSLHLGSFLRLAFGSLLPIYDAFVLSSTFTGFKDEQIYTTVRHEKNIPHSRIVIM